jgi:hypothetical protein
MNLIDRLHCVQVVDTRVKAYLIHDYDACGSDTLFQSPNRRRDVTGRDNVFFGFDGGFDDRNMERVRDKRDNYINSSDGLLE